MTNKNNDRGARALRNDEAHILQSTQEMYGNQNQPAECFGTDQDEMVIFVKDRRGQSPIMVNLTSVADIAKEQSLTDQAIKEKWLKPP